ncbi:MAG: hypothetical protein ACUVTW_14540 [Thermogutta sp.]
MATTERESIEDETNVGHFQEAIRIDRAQLLGHPHLEELLREGVEETLNAMLDEGGGRPARRPVDGEHAYM